MVVSRAPHEQIRKFQQRMGWKFEWMSSYGTDFNQDFQVSFRKDDVDRGKAYYNYEFTSFPSEEAPGLSVFAKGDNGDVFHTYSSYGRGLDILVGTYNMLDLAPKGRDEDGLAFSMSWVRHHDRYDNGPVDSRAEYQQPKVSSSCCD
jgi:predicted dithiol-disulfide oxidoreductase (DUF899 family)